MTTTGPTAAPAADPPPRCLGCGGDLAGCALSAWCRACDPRWHWTRYCLDLRREVRQALEAVGKWRPVSELLP
jgi:hypothetical protein